MVWKETTCRGKKSHGPDFSTVRKSANGSVVTYQRVFSSLAKGNHIWGFISRNELILDKRILVIDQNSFFRFLLCWLWWFWFVFFTTVPLWYACSNASFTEVYLEASSTNPRDFIMYKTYTAEPKSRLPYLNKGHFVWLCVNPIQFIFEKNQKMFWSIWKMLAMVLRTEYHSVCVFYLQRM